MFWGRLPQLCDLLRFIAQMKFLGHLRVPLLCHYSATAFRAIFLIKWDKTNFSEKELSQHIYCSHNVSFGEILVVRLYLPEAI